MKNYKSKLLILALLFLPLLFSFEEPDQRHFEIAKNMEIFGSVYREVNKYYVEGTEPAPLMKAGIDAMLKTLDPYTNYIPEEAIENYRIMTTGEYGGIGAMIGTRKDRVLVLLPYKGFPADKAGLHIGDEITVIDGTNTKGKTSAEISKLLRGQADTQLSLEVKRIGETDPLKFNFSRGKVKMKSVPYHGMLNDEVGYFKLTSFTATAANEVENAVRDLKRQGAKQLVFDLRDNTGGLLFQAIEICNFFIPKGKIIVSTRGKVSDWNKEYKSQKDPLDKDIPLVILTNGMSASASEIVSGVLQDYDRAVVIGQNTYGKGLVQSTFETAYNSKVKITTAKYYIPSGRCIQEIDYGKKDNDGNSPEVADSLRTEFHTECGRAVFDGKGISPDIKMKQDTLDEFLHQLHNNDVFFDYAVEYFYSHNDWVPETPTAYNFSTQDFKDFVIWFNKREYDFKLSAEKNLEELEEYLYNDKKQLTEVKQEIENRKKQVLLENEELISDIIQEQLIAHYFYKPGKIEAGLSHDKDVNEAIKVLKETTLYKGILINK
jgi:carboxyl-terminal processing protease